MNGLAEEGKVISVRLALFAEMMKGKPWTPATLEEVGGTKGVGVTFLEETFSASTAPPEHRLHQKAAQAVLKALLPESGTDIKGQMRSRQELLEASGYANRPRDFDDLIHILDPELRLITPTDPEGSSSEDQATPTERAILPARTRLPGPLPAGLADPQAAGDPSRTGGAAAGGTVVALERQAREPPSAVCPGVGEHPAADEEEGLDRAAAPDDEAGGAGAWLTDAGIGRAGLLDRPGAGSRAMAHLRASALVESLQKADTTDVPPIVEQLSGYRRWADPSARCDARDTTASMTGNICTPASPSARRSLSG